MNKAIKTGSLPLSTYRSKKLTNIISVIPSIWDVKWII